MGPHVRVQPQLRAGHRGAKDQRARPVRGHAEPLPVSGERFSVALGSGSGSGSLCFFLISTVPIRFSTAPRGDVSYRTGTSREHDAGCVRETQERGASGARGGGGGSILCVEREREALEGGGLKGCDTFSPPVDLSPQVSVPLCLCPCDTHRKFRDVKNVGVHRLAAANSSFENVFAGRHFCQSVFSLSLFFCSRLDATRCAVQRRTLIWLTVEAKYQQQ